MRRPLLLLILLLGWWPAQAIAGQPATPRGTVPADCLTIERFPVPAGDGPHDVAPSANGKGIWYSGQRAGVLGLFDPATGEVQRIALGAGSSPHGVVVGPDDAAWVTDTGLNAIVRVDAETKEVQAFPLPPEAAGANLNTAAFDPDGILWFTGQNGVIGSVDPATGNVAVVTAPRGRGPYGITSTPDGAVWFASLAGDFLGQIEVEAITGAITAREVDPPTPGAGPRRVWSDSGGALWISEWNAGQVGRYDPATRSWQEWRLPGSNPAAYAVFVDDQDVVWLSDFGGNSLVRFDPETETFMVVPLPDPDAAVRQLNGRPGEVWGAESAVDTLVVVRTSCGDGDAATPPPA